MAEISSELIYEVLKDLQHRLGRIESDMHDTKMRLTSMDQKLALIHGDLALLSERVDRLEVRVERIEKRLGMLDPIQ